MRAIVVAGTHSGVGKTTVSIGLMAAFKRLGLGVQPFKVGPDFIDPSHHRRASGRVSRNLDGWMLSREYNQNLFHRHARAADIAVVEGVMGLFDGSSGKADTGSTAEIARWIQAPVLLVVDASAMARSAAALVKGFAEFDTSIKVAGVIFNRVGGAGHLQYLKEALESSAVPVLGGLPREESIQIPERHLGLRMAGEPGLPAALEEKLSDLVLKQLDWKKILEIAQIPDVILSGAKDLQIGGPSPHKNHMGLRMTHEIVKNVRIGVAQDEAFCFYYEDNFDWLRSFGAEIVPFSPLRDSLPENLDALYFGGGYPELHREALGSNRVLLGEVRDFAACGKIIYGECGGLMYLSQGIEAMEDGRTPLCGIFPFWTKMTSRCKIGYAEIKLTQSGLCFPFSETARGHRFHYSEIDSPASEAQVYEVRPVYGPPLKEGFAAGNVLASYYHLHFGSHPAFARSFVEHAAKQKTVSYP